MTKLNLVEQVLLGCFDVFFNMPHFRLPDYRLIINNNNNNNNNNNRSAAPWKLRWTFSKEHIAIPKHRHAASKFAFFDKTVPGQLDRRTEVNGEIGACNGGYIV